MDMRHNFNTAATYAEAAYFDGDHCQHVADRNENLRLARIARQTRAAIAYRTR